MTNVLTCSVHGCALIAVYGPNGDFWRYECPLEK